jgi:glycosyltransferase involved in cell wall biosynthesis
MRSTLPTGASVIVPVRNGGRILRDCLEALFQQEWVPEEYEVIVVDDGSTDATAAIAQAAGARVISQPNRGRAAARNAGAFAARGEILLFTDADCVPARDWLRRMLEPFADPAVQGAKGIYTTQQTELIARFSQHEYEEKYRRMAALERIDFVDTYSAAYRRSLFVACGGFDPRIPAGGDDHELSYRLAAQGHKLVFQPSAVVRHRHPTSLSSYLRRKFTIGFWKVLVHRRHPGKLVSDSHNPPTARLQVALAYLDVVLLLGWLAGAVPARAVGLGLGVFAATGAGFAISARRDPAVAVVAIPIVAARSLAAGAGMALGLLDALFTRRWIRWREATSA